MFNCPENIHRKLPVLLFLLAACCGCIREDLSGCFNNLIISFEPINPKHNYPELVRTVALYFYDQDEELFFHRHYEREQLDGSDRAAVIADMPPGEYTVVAMINHSSQHKTVDYESLSTLRSYLNEWWIEERLDDYFSGMQAITVPHDNRSQQETMSIFKHNNDIRVQVIFEGYTVPEDFNLGCLLYGKDGMYHYKSHSATEDVEVVTLPYFVQYDTSGQPVTFYCSTMRLWRDLELSLLLAEYDQEYNTGETFLLDIPKELGKITDSSGDYPYDTDEELEYHDQYNITITLGGGFIVLSIKINDWYLIGGNKDV